MKFTDLTSWIKLHKRLTLIVSCLLLILCLGGGAAVLHLTRNTLPDDGSLELLLDEDLKDTDHQTASNADVKGNDSESQNAPSNSSGKTSGKVSEDSTDSASTDSSDSPDPEESPNAPDQSGNESPSGNPGSSESPDSPESPDSGDSNNGVIQTNHPYELPFIPVNP